MPKWSFRKAVALMQQDIADAIAGYEAVLRPDAGHDRRVRRWWPCC
jgi:hypothetical protein